jgi:hypothetical protein
VAEIVERAPNSRVDPTRVVSSHPHDELCDLGRRGQTAGLVSPAAIVFPGEQPLVPAKQRVWRHQCVDPAQAEVSDDLDASTRVPQHGGMSLHADVAVPTRDRRCLERLCRYVARPPLAGERLELRSEGALTLRLKTRWRDGTPHILREPSELIERLVPLIPLPRAPGPLPRHPGAGGKPARPRRTGPSQPGTSRRTHPTRSHRRPTGGRRSARQGTPDALGRTPRQTPRPPRWRQLSATAHRMRIG